MPPIRRPHRKGSGSSPARRSRTRPAKGEDDTGDTDSGTFDLDVLLGAPPEEFQLAKVGTQAVRGRIIDYAIQDRSKKEPRRVKFKVVGKNGFWSVPSGDVPLQLTLSFGDGELGLCGETAFTAAECSANKKGTTVKCRR